MTHLKRLNTFKGLLKFHSSSSDGPSHRQPGENIFLNSLENF